MLTKQYQTRVKMLKDADGAPTGEVTAVVSVFGNVDKVGDRVVKGAFAKTLEEFKSNGDPIPMIWSHDWSNPMSHIGEWDASKAVETDEGLELSGKVHIGEGNPVADQAFRLMDKNLVREFSFAYDVISEQTAKADGANELLELALIEAGPTLKGANSETRLVAAKALESLAKVGRSISAKNESQLREALEAMTAGATAIKSVLSALDATEEKSVEEIRAAKEAAALAEAEAEAEAAVSDAVDEADEEDDDEKNGEPDPITLGREDVERIAKQLNDIHAELVLGLDLDDLLEDEDGA